jgi:hypothetical protein
MVKNYLSPQLTVIFYKVPRTDKCNALAFQTANLLQLNPICQS